MRSRLRGLLAGLVILTLAGCAQHPPLPEASPPLALPQKWHVQTLGDAEPQDWLLVIQDDGPGLRWSLFSPLGTPLARQRLHNGSWHNDGLLPPNPLARELFSAQLFALTPREALANHWPASRLQATDTERSLAQGDSHWQIEFEDARTFRLTLNNTHRYWFRPL